jgi:putative hemolysin
VQGFNYENNQYDFMNIQASSEQMTESDDGSKYIDIGKIIEEGNSKFLKKLPRFVIRLVARIIRQDELNYILNKYAGYTGAEFMPKIMEEFNLKLEIDGEENLPEDGRCLFIGNHPFGIIDGLILTLIVSRKYGTLKAIANDSFNFVPQLRPFIAAVTVYGRSSKDYLNAIDEVYKSDEPVTHFPAGLVSRVVKGKVRDIPWKKSFIKKAVSSKRDIVPFHFHGRNSNLFYAIFLFRKLFGIKTVIELSLLPHEMFKKRNKTIRVTIGKPIPHEMFDKSHPDQEWAQKVRSHVYALGTDQTEDLLN